MVLFHHQDILDYTISLGTNNSRPVAYLSFVVDLPERLEMEDDDEAHWHQVVQKGRDQIVLEELVANAESLLVIHYAPYHIIDGYELGHDELIAVEAQRIGYHEQ